MIEQERFFAGLDFEKQVFLGLTCYKGRDGAYYRVSHFTNSYVIEYAENETQAKCNAFEDADLFRDDLSEFDIIAKVNHALRIYTMNQKDIDEKYNLICKKLGFIPKETQSKIVDQDCTEDDSKINPYSVLSPDEIDFLFLNGLLK